MPNDTFVPEETPHALPSPDNTAVRVALWRALHLEVDAEPHVFVDTVGLELVSPEAGWQQRPDMSPFTQPFRASILARARFIDDLVVQETRRGLSQYVILGAGLDTFAQRHPELASQLTIYEVDRPEAQAWKRQRLEATGHGIAAHLRLIPADFETGMAWGQQLGDAGFDATRPTVIASTGVSMYLTKSANEETLRQVAALGADCTFVMSFMVPLEMTDPTIRSGVERAAAGARAAGTPFVGFFTPEEMLALAKAAGFAEVEHISSGALAERYFAARTDGLRPPNHAEELLVARTKG